MLNASKYMPSDFGSIYSQTLDQINSQSKSQAHLAHKLLSWLVLAKRNLSIEELIEATAVEIGTSSLDSLNKRTPSTLTKVCKGLVVIDEQSGSVRLAHITVYDFLTASLLQLDRMRTEICQICLTYLSFSTFATGPNLGTRSFKSKAAQNPFFMYASSYLDDHLREAGDDPLLFELLWNFATTPPLYESYLQGKSYRTYHQYLDAADLWTCDMTPLHVAAGLGHTALVRRLLDSRSGDLNALNQKGETPLLVAISFGHEAIVATLLDHGAAVESIGGDSALNCAARNRHDGIVRLLLEHGSSGRGMPVDRQGHELLVATIAGNGLAVANLLQQGTNPETKDADGGTALQWAAWYGHKQIILDLIKFDASVEAADHTGRRALHEASERGHADVVRILVEHGADVNALDSFGYTPLIRAVYKGSLSTVLVLLEAGADINVQSTRDFSIRGSVALYCAVSNGDVQMVRLLLDLDVQIEGFDFDNVCYSHGISYDRYIETKSLVHDALAKFEHAKKRKEIEKESGFTNCTSDISGINKNNDHDDGNDGDDDIIHPEGTIHLSSLRSQTMKRKKKTKGMKGLVMAG